MELKPGYKQTEVGVIPGDWSTPELGQILKSMQLGGNYKNSEIPTRWPLIKMGNLGRGTIKLDRLDFVDSKQSPAVRDRLCDGDVLFNTRNTLELVGKVAIWKEELPEAYFNSNIMRMDFDEQRVSSSAFMNFILNTAKSITSLRGIATGTTSVAAIYGRDLAKIVIPLPTKAEQVEIAEALSDADALIESLDQLIAKKRQIKQGAMQELLTGKRRLPGFSGEWVVRPLASVVADLEAGVSVNSIEITDPFSTAEPCILKTSAIFDGNFNPAECKLIDHRDTSRARLSPRRDSIIISRMNTPNLVGEVGYVAEDFPSLYLPDRLWMTRFVNGADVSVRWLSYVLSSPLNKESIKGLATGTSGSMKNISKSAFLSLHIAFPSESEQTAIANILSDMDTEIAALQSQLAKARQIKQGMMQELLTGRIRLL